MRLQAGDGIDPAGGKEDHACAVAATLLKAMVGTDQIGLEEVIGRAVLPGEDRWLGGALDHQIEGTIRECIRMADVSPVKGDSGSLQTCNVELRTLTVKVIHHGDGGLGECRAEHQGDV